jgi:acyl-coenzyme A thioesterase PaaI-like protein
MAGGVEAFGKWTESVEALVSYRYLGCRSELVDAARAVGHMPLRSDMRFGAGLLGTPLAIAMLDTAGINIDRIRFGALTHVALQVFDAGDGVSRVCVEGEVPRLARRAIFTECVISDAGNPGRIIAHGSADWISLGDVSGFTYTDPGPGVPDEPPMPPLAEAYLVEAMGDGTYRIPALDPRIGTELLHHGPALVALEWQANATACAAAPDAGLRLSTFDVRLLRGGTRPPFTTRSRGSQRVGASVWARAELVDGAGDVLSRIETVHAIDTR